MIIVKGGTLVTPMAEFNGDIAVENGKIVRVEDYITPSRDDEVVDAAGCRVFPGFIDAHTHLDMGSGAAKTADDFSSGTAAALCGGTTTIIDYACQSQGGTLKQALKEWHGKADNASFCDYGFHMSIVDWNTETKTELQDMVNAGVTSFKMYMAYDALRLNDADILDALFEMKKLGAIACVHCENGDIVNLMTSRLKALGDFAPSAHPKSRPAPVEAEAISRLLYMARIADYPVNVVHLSSLEGLEAIRFARVRGQKVFVETCPQYMLLDESNYSRDGFEGAKYVCSPPLRGAQDVNAIAVAASVGEINTISTDHCGFYFDGQKTIGVNDFSLIPNGLPGIEFRPGLIYGQFVKTEMMTASRMCALLSENPAKLYGMYPKKGALLPGSDADIVVWKDGDYRVDSAHQHMKCDYSPYEGMRMSGYADTVLLRGKIAARGGEPVAENLGQYVNRRLPMMNEM